MSAVPPTPDLTGIDHDLACVLDLAWRNLNWFGAASAQDDLRSPADDREMEMLGGQDWLDECEENLCWLAERLECWFRVYEEALDG